MNTEMSIYGRKTWNLSFIDRQKGVLENGSDPGKCVI